VDLPAAVSSSSRRSGWFRAVDGFRCKDGVLRKYRGAAALRCRPEADSRKWNDNAGSVMLFDSVPGHHPVNNVRTGQTGPPLLTGVQAHQRDSMGPDRPAKLSRVPSVLLLPPDVPDAAAGRGADVRQRRSDFARLPRQVE
jgi:hypothetical protein